MKKQELEETEAMLKEAEAKLKEAKDGLKEQRAESKRLTNPFYEHGVVLKNDEEYWEKIKAELLKDIPELKKLIEFFHVVVLSDDDKSVIYEQKIPQSLKDAKKNKYLQYYADVQCLTNEQYNKKFTLHSYIMNNGKFMELVMAVAEHDKKEQIKQAIKNGFIPPDDVNVDLYNLEGMPIDEQKNMIRQTVDWSRKIEKMSKDELMKTLQQNHDFQEQIPSEKIVEELRKAETFLNDEYDWFKDIYSFGNYFYFAFYHYFQAGRAYEKAINKPFNKAIEHELNIMRSKLENKEFKIEQWGQRIHKQRQKYINQGMSRTGKAIRLALNDIAEQYGKENADDYDRRMNKYDNDKDKTEKSIREHIRSNYWHKFKKKKNLK
jgi:hypothetical protein